MPSTWLLWCYRWPWTYALCGKNGAPPYNEGIAAGAPGHSGQPLGQYQQLFRLQFFSRSALILTVQNRFLCKIPPKNTTWAPSPGKIQKIVGLRFCLQSYVFDVVSKIFIFLMRVIWKIQLCNGQFNFT